MRYNKLFLAALLFALASTAYSLTIDELLSLYDWNINNPGVTVNSITPSNLVELSLFCV